MKTAKLILEQRQFPPFREVSLPVVEKTRVNGHYLGFEDMPEFLENWNALFKPDSEAGPPGEAVLVLCSEDSWECGLFFKWKNAMFFWGNLFPDRAGDQLAFLVHKDTNRFYTIEDILDALNQGKKPNIGASWWTPLDSSHGLTEKDIRPYKTHGPFEGAIGERDHCPGDHLEILAVQME